ncbi:type II toxin-antitoxin system VapB family antitoxin [Pacificispira sp.]|uniref:type II toxin-antitoxin system VapB family antitoxin n=1 Tax=Pacificispira sp. TaxID=2888761 RepID=UPI003BACC8D6
MTKTTIFTNNRTQAVRIPKALAFPAHVTAVEIAEIGTARVIAPGGALWDDFFAAPGVTDDFMPDGRTDRGRGR